MTLNEFKIFILDCDKSCRYMILSQMQIDCDFYLGEGCRNPEYLWAKNEKKQIKFMKILWNDFSLDEKPEWLSYQQILEYEKKMIGAPTKQISKD